MILQNGKIIGISGNEFTTALEGLKITFQPKIIRWNNENKLVTTVLQEIFEVANGKIQLVLADTLPQTTVTNTQYWVKTYDGETLETGRYIIITDTLNVAHYIGTTETDLTEYLKKTDVEDRIYGTDSLGEQTTFAKKSTPNTTPNANTILDEVGTQKMVKALIKNDDIEAMDTTLGAGKIVDLIENYTPDLTKDLQDVDWNKANVSFDSNYANVCKKAGKYYGLMAKVNIPNTYTATRTKILELPFAIDGTNVVYGYKTIKREIDGTNDYDVVELAFIEIVGKDVYCTLEKAPNLNITHIEINCLVDRADVMDNGTDYSDDFKTLNGGLTFKNLFYREYNGMTICSFYATMNNVSKITFPTNPTHNMETNCIVEDGNGLHHGIALINKTTKEMPVDTSYTGIAMQVVWFNNASDETNFGADIIDANPNADIIVSNARYINGFALQEFALNINSTVTDVEDEVVKIDRTPVALAHQGIVSGSIEGTYTEVVEEVETEYAVIDNNGKIVIGEEEAGTIDYALGSIAWNETKTGTLVLSYQYENVEAQNIDETINITHTHWIRGVEARTDLGEVIRSATWDKIKSSNSKLCIDNKKGRVEVNGMVMSISDLPTIVLPDIPSRHGTYLLACENGILKWVE